MKISDFLNKKEVFFWVLIGAILFQLIWYSYNYYTFDITVQNLSSERITDITLESTKVNYAIKILDSQEKKRLILLRSHIQDGKELKISFKTENQNRSIVLFNGDSRKLDSHEYGQIYIYKNDSSKDLIVNFDIMYEK